MIRPNVTSFFDEKTFTVSHVVVDPNSKSCAIIDSVLDYCASSGRTATDSVDSILEFVRRNDLKVEWILETHAHADHLSAAPYLKSKTNGQIAIGDHIDDVQKVFGSVFNEGESFARDGSQFDRLFSDNDSFEIGHLPVQVWYVPGHTSACIAFLIGDSVFVGDTLFMPDYGTARCDFPGGDAGTLYDSIQRLYTLSDETRVFLCHDYKAPGRDEYVWETTIGAQKQGNIHVNHMTSREDFIALRNARDETLSMPNLILPSIQVNMRAGDLPEPEDNGIRYLKIPINAV